ncbi:hypothetical protein GCM10022220_18110 [Actinocatenispora rupis]|uniref:YNCE-like beta-propeller domain-containing protein n=2 Tax=Actinocatenispora rupis TaxID=519421 RepID=A0A8J3IW00_9ACTN|nr:hypothetical protein Aru02nite_18650 [Actinocatenispora rupis]
MMPGSRVRRCAAAGVLLLAATLTGCTGTHTAPRHATARHAAATTHPSPAPAGLPGMPPVADPHNVYRDAGANMLAPAVRHDPPLVYVPHNGSGDVWVIDQRTFRVVARYPAGVEVQHVVPSWDLRTLYSTDDVGNHLRAFDPRTGKAGRTIAVVDPYNLYFTPDGRYGISVAEDHRALYWYDPHSWAQRAVTPLPKCAGADHAEFSADGRTAVFTCEFAGAVAVVDVASRRLLRMVDMPRRYTHMGPQDIKLAPDGRHWYVADCDAGGLWVLDGAARSVQRFVRTGACAHGLYFDRPARRMFVSDRMAGSVSVLDAYTARPLATWHLPGGGSPDMGNVTADGRQLWLSGRYDDVVYVLSTSDGRLIRRIPVGNGPHGLCVWPQPGRYSLGHTGITR